MKHVAVVLALFAMLMGGLARAESPRDMLVSAAFTTRDKGAALQRVQSAYAAADAAYRRNPQDRDARLQRALALSYRGKLSRSRSDVILARKEFEALIAADPRNPEAQVALGAWHLAAIIEFGPMMARTVLGARTSAGNQAFDRALALDRDRASIPALASLQRIQVNPDDIAGARRLAETAQRTGASTAFDRVMQKQVGILLPALRPGNGKVAAAMAKLLMPFGRIPG